MLRLGLSLALLAILVSVQSRPTSAQVSDADIGTNEALLALFPELRTLPAPAFVAPGVRVSYVSGAATGNGGPAGGGVIQYDVLTRDASHVLAYQSNYGDVGAGVVPLGNSAVRGYPGLGAFWINTSVLVGAERFNSDSLTVTRSSKALSDGTPVNVVRFQTDTANGRVATEFDSDRGAMVFDTISSGPSAAQLELLSVRNLTLPWQPGRAPNWVRPGAALQFSGPQTTVVAGASITQALDVDVVIVEAGARWSLATATQRLDGVASGQGVQATGQGQLIGALWVPQTALDAELPGTPSLVDADPVTGGEVYVSRNGDGSIVLEYLLGAARLAWFYNPVLGVLDRQVVESNDLASFSTMDLARVGGDSALETLAGEPPLPDDPTESEAGSGDDDGGGSGDGDGGGDGDGSPPDEDDGSEESSGDSGPAASSDAGVAGDGGTGAGGGGSCHVATPARARGIVPAAWLVGVALLIRRRFGTRRYPTA
ncbi:MAG: hypothetical protein OXT09_07140 [Myxococcales bacterium]|nr:hypothetical protein [Myxococcales bacterium]